MMNDDIDRMVKVLDMLSTKLIHGLITPLEIIEEIGVRTINEDGCVYPKREPDGTATFTFKVMRVEKGQSAGLAPTPLSPDVIVEQWSPEAGAKCHWCGEPASTAQFNGDVILNLCPKCTAKRFVGRSA